MINTKAIEEHVRGILRALGDDPGREGLRETPQRVAAMYEEVFAGMKYTNEEIGNMFRKTFADGRVSDMADAGRVVVMKDIDMFSFCDVRYESDCRVYSGRAGSGAFQDCPHL